MLKWLIILAQAICSALKIRQELALENLALRQQVASLTYRRPRPQLTDADRLIWALISRLWSAWRSALHVPTATFRDLFVLIVLSQDRRRILHFNVTAHPTADWTARQLVEACGSDNTPRFLLRDHDSIYGTAFRRRTAVLKIEEITTAPRSPWQNPYAERVIGSIRRECLEHMVILGQRHLKRILASYVDYYHHSVRTHLSLEKDSLDGQPTQSPSQGNVAELHHEYVRMAA